MLYARQTAWFAATPEGSKTSRLEQHKQRSIAAVDSDEGEDPSVKVPEETQEIPYPELPKGAEYLVSLFYSAGSATQTGMGLVPLSWQEIESWVRCNGLDDSVTPWELSVVRRMSEAYASEYAAASSPKRPQPYQPTVEVEKLDRDAVAAKVMSVLATFKRK